MTTTTATTTPPTWQSGPQALPQAATTTGVKRALGRRLDVQIRGREDRRLIGGCQLPQGVRILWRDMGMYTQAGTYAVTGGPRAHVAKGHLRAYETLDLALIDAFNRVEFANQLDEAARAAFPVGTVVTFAHRPRYGARAELVEGVVTGHGMRYENSPEAGYVTVRKENRDRYYRFDAGQLERRA